MVSVLDILIVEDSEDDALLIVQEVEMSGYQVVWERVATAEDLSDRLAQRAWDIIISEYTLSRFSGLDALVLVNNTGLDIPFIISSNASSEEVAVSVMKAGAGDFIIKSNLARLLPAIEREIREAKGRKQRRRAESALHRSEERYRRLFEEALTGNFMASPAGIILDCNPAFARIFGFSDSDEVMGTNLYDLYPNTSAWDLSLKQLKSFKKLENQAAELCRPDKTTVYVIQNIAGVFNHQGELVEIQGFLIDDTERREMEKQVGQVQRMESLGTLAGGIAHDFNNLLTVISGYSDMVFQKLEPGDPLKSLMEEVVNSADRAAALTQQILAFSRQQVVQPRLLNIGEVINNTGKLMQRLISENIHLTTTIADDLKYIKIDPVQVEQIIMNLAINARDAMPNGGQCDIKAYNVALTEHDMPYLEGLTPGIHVVLEVRDTGIGMDEQTRDHIFEPFFTTKAVNEGTGLGLSTVYGIVTQNKGAIRVESTPGEGSAFFIYFPQSEEIPSWSSTTTTPDYADGNTETILLVEDDATVRNMAQIGLMSSGYHVVTATDGVEALRWATSTDKKIHLLLTDLMMPNMNGQELTRKMLDRIPDLKVLFISGYLDRIESQDDLFKLQTHMLPKPFTINTLLQKVWEILDHPD